jgi:CubicO group peptidase (beta-lactamase class C family)
VLDEAIARGLGRRPGLVLAAICGGQEAVRVGGDVSVDALFEIGSVTKVFTATLLADLSLAGSLSLDEPLQAALPDVRVPTRDGAITLEHLATHCSGLPRLPPGFVRRARRERQNPYGWLREEDVLAALERTRLRSRPGTKVRYSNFGAGLLGIALARRAGMPYGELLRMRVLEPLGLHDTGIAIAPERLATGHSRRGRPVAHWDVRGLEGAGALRSSAGDVLRFAKACLEPPADAPGPALALTLVPRRRLSRFGDIGLGWFLGRRKEGWTVAWHNGGTGGFRSFVGVALGREVGVVALTNSTRSADRLALRTVERLARH